MDVSKKEEMDDEQLTPEQERKIEEIKSALATKLSESIGFPLKPKWVSYLVCIECLPNLMLLNPDQVAEDILKNLMSRYDTGVDHKNPQDLLTKAVAMKYGYAFLSHSSAGVFEVGETPSLQMFHALQQLKRIHPELFELAEKLWPLRIAPWAKQEILESALKDVAHDILTSYKNDPSHFWDPEFQELEAIDPAAAQELYK